MKKIMLIILLLSVSSLSVRAQNEFFVTVNPADGTFKKISSFPDVNWIEPRLSVYSQKLHRYYFCGSSDVNTWVLYTIDVLNGNIINTDTVRNSEFDFIKLSGAVYNDIDDRIYAMYKRDVVELISIDSKNLSYYSVAKIPELMYRDMYANIDTKNNRYIISGTDSMSVDRLYVLDIATGNLVGDRPISFYPAFMKLDSDLGLAYGIQSSKELQNIVSIDPTTGEIAMVRPMTEMNGAYGGGNFFTYSQRNKKYIYASINKSDKPCIASVSMRDKLLESFPDFPHVNGAGDNIICWQYDDSLDQLFAIHWEPMPKGHRTRLYPNPFTQTTTAFLDTIYTAATTILYSTDGKEAQKNEDNNTNKVPVNRNNLSSGTYYMRIYGNGRLLGVEKAVVE
ncbi:MAG: hypothetical protein JWQ38_786 [Flavipsychrobacter sp.]|nr:hypothetical protein [Flavipsychrobacter sp.]